MVEIASKIIICLVLSSVIGMFIGFLIGRATSRGSANSSTINPIFTKQGNVYNKPFILGHPRPSGKDNLKEIEGISPAIEISLNNTGIFHYDQISKWTQNNCEWVEKYLSIEGKVIGDHWIEQAKRLASKRL